MAIDSGLGEREIFGFVVLVCGWREKFVYFFRVRRARGDWIWNFWLMARIRKLSIFWWFELRLCLIGIFIVGFIGRSGIGFLGYLGGLLRYLYWIWRYFLVILWRFLVEGKIHLVIGYGRVSIYCYGGIYRGRRIFESVCRCIRSILGICERLGSLRGGFRWIVCRDRRVVFYFIICSCV